ncbi:MAG: GNAT family N-acetyltransferase [Actinomycetota bacterium]|jgi:ribosomal protein S18 acetylase RimI-like enzyme|nr:GNAT family N-acetyltransferase [Actinomycetota bacterium]
MQPRMDPGNPSAGPDPASSGLPPPEPRVSPPTGSSAPLWVVTSGVQAPAEIRRLLGSLPEWFGIESSVDEYVADAARLPTYLAWQGSGTGQSPRGQSATGPAAGPAAADVATGEHPVGAMLVARHFPETAEIHLLAVEPGLHRSGVGRALVDALERDLIAEGVRLLEVKTLGPSHPDAGYALTREFYRAMGFLPVEEIIGLWPDNPCLVMIKVLTRSTDRPAPDRPAPDQPAH